MSRRVLLKPTHRYGCFSGCSRDANQRARYLEWEVMWQDRKGKQLHMTGRILLLKAHLVHQQNLLTEQCPWDIRCLPNPYYSKTHQSLWFFSLSAKKSTATILPAMPLGSSSSQARSRSGCSSWPLQLNRLLSSWDPCPEEAPPVHRGDRMWMRKVY